MGCIATGNVGDVDLALDVAASNVQVVYVSGSFNVGLWWSGEEASAGGSSGKELSKLHLREGVTRESI